MKKSKEELITLLKTDEFNQYRKDTNNQPIDLSNSDLRKVDLRFANLSYVNLSNSDLKFANLRYANLSNSDLYNAHLRYADLRYAILTNANITKVNLWDTLGNGKEINTLQTPYYTCNLTKDVLWIGCHGKPYDEWLGLSKEKIKKLGKDALDFYNEWKDVLIKIKDKIK